METGNVTNEAMNNEGMQFAMGIAWIEREREGDRQDR